MAENVVIIKKPSRKKSGGAKKIGRNIAKCKAYRQLGIREINKSRKKLKHEKRVAKKAAKLAAKLAARAGRE